MRSFKSIVYDIKFKSFSNSLIRLFLFEIILFICKKPPPFLPLGNIGVVSTFSISAVEVYITMLFGAGKDASAV